MIDFSRIKSVSIPGMADVSLIKINGVVVWRRGGPTPPPVGTYTVHIVNVDGFEITAIPQVFNEGDYIEVHVAGSDPRKKFVNWKCSQDSDFSTEYPSVFYEDYSDSNVYIGPASDLYLTIAEPENLTMLACSAGVTDIRFYDTEYKDITTTVQVSGQSRIGCYAHKNSVVFVASGTTSQSNMCLSLVASGDTLPNNRITVPAQDVVDIHYNKGKLSGSIGYTLTTNKNYFGDFLWCYDFRLYNSSGQDITPGTSSMTDLVIGQTYTIRVTRLEDYPQAPPPNILAYWSTSTSFHNISWEKGIIPLTKISDWEWSFVCVYPCENTSTKGVSRYLHIGADMPELVRVQVQSSDQGTLILPSEWAEAYRVYKFTPHPNIGYVLDYVEVYDEQGDIVEDCVAGEFYCIPYAYGLYTFVPYFRVSGPTHWAQWSPHVEDTQRFSFNKNIPGNIPVGYQVVATYSPEKIRYYLREFYYIDDQGIRHDISVTDNVGRFTMPDSDIELLYARGEDTTLYPVNVVQPLPDKYPDLVQAVSERLAGDDVGVVVDTYQYPDFRNHYKVTRVYYTDPDGVEHDLEFDMSIYYKPYPQPIGGSTVHVDVEEIQYYDVLVATITGGTITVNPTTQTAGGTVNASISVQEGYLFKFWDIRDSDGNVITPTTQTGNTCKFTMPAKNVTVSAVLEEHLPGFPITVVCPDGHGTASVNPTRAERDEFVALTIVPQDGYVLDTVTIVADYGGTTEYLPALGGFNMLNGPTTVTVTFKEAASGYTIHFHDFDGNIYIDDVFAFQYGPADIVLTPGQHKLWNLNRGITNLSITGPITVVSGSPGDQTWIIDVQGDGDIRGY